MATSADPDLPLADWRVLVTRPVDQAQPLAEALRAAGATAISYPTITIAPPPSWIPFDEAVTRLESYDWIVFTSPSAARLAMARAAELLGRLRLPDAPAVAAVGAETARALAAHAIPVALVPDDQRQEGLLAALGTRAAGARILFPQALDGRSLLRDELARAGATVDVVPVSRTIALPLPVPPAPFDAATFASPSALHAFLARWTPAALQDKVVAVMGPTTRDAALAAGVAVQVIPARPSVAALVAALAQHRRPS